MQSRERKATVTIPGMATSYTATIKSDGPFFAADLIDLTELDKLIDEGLLRTGAYNTGWEALYGDDAEYILHALRVKAVDYTHKLYLKAKPTGAPGDSPETFKYGIPVENLASLRHRSTKSDGSFLSLRLY